MMIARRVYSFIFTESSGTELSIDVGRCGKTYPGPPAHKYKWWETT